MSFFVGLVIGFLGGLYVCHKHGDQLKAKYEELKFKYFK